MYIYLILKKFKKKNSFSGWNISSSLNLNSTSSSLMNSICFPKNDTMLFLLKINNHHVYLIQILNINIYLLI